MGSFYVESERLKNEEYKQKTLFELLYNLFVQADSYCNCHSLAAS